MWNSLTGRCTLAKHVLTYAPEKISYIFQLITNYHTFYINNCALFNCFYSNEDIITCHKMDELLFKIYNGCFNKYASEHFHKC